jgi:hypothetical protein
MFDIGVRKSAKILTLDRCIVSRWPWPPLRERRGFSLGDRQDREDLAGPGGSRSSAAVHFL